MPDSSPYKLQEPVLYDWRGEFAQFYVLQQSGTLCDVTVRARDGELRVHSLVMFTRVPYFRALLEFSSSSGRGGLTETDLSDHDMECVECVIKFIYTGAVEIPTVELLHKVFCLADYLQISNLRTQCEDSIFSQLSLSNCVSLANFSCAYGSIVSAHHQERVLRFLLTRWNKVLVECNWKPLAVQVFTKLVISDEFNVKNEEQVLRAVLEWIAYCPSRAPYLHRLLQHVRLHVLPESVLKELEHHELVRAESPCLRLIEEGRYFASNVKCDTARIKLKPRTYLDKSICVMCIYKSYPPDVQYPKPDFSNVVCPHSRETLSRQYEQRYSAAYRTEQNLNNCNVLVYSKTHDHWEQPLAYIPRCWAQDTALTAHGYSIHLLGNRQWQFGNMLPSDESYDSTCSFDRLSHTWQAGSNLPFPVMFNVCGSVAGRIFSCGGLNLARSVAVGAYCIPSFILQDEETGHWDYLADMQCARRHHSAVALYDKVYVTGGKGNGEDLSPCPFSECLDVTSNKWMKLPNPANNRSKLSSCASDQRVFVLGGFNLSPDKLCYDYTLESYDPREGSWSLPLPLPGKYFDFRTAYLDGEVYMIGGCTSFDPYGEDDVWSRDVHVLDLRAMRWRAGTPMPPRPPPDDEVDEILSGLLGTGVPSIPIPTGTAVLH